MSDLIEALGLSKEEMADRVVDQAVERILRTTHMDEDGNEDTQSSDLARRMNELVKARIDSKVAELAAVHVLPNVAQFIENLTLQQTTKWGEKTGKAMTFVEYLVARAEVYMQEKVDHRGKSNAEDGSGYNWSGNQTRITYLIHEHLQYSITTAMTSALKTAQESIAVGIAETVKQTLAKITTTIGVTVKS